jgi:hypothetical protein
MKNYTKDGITISISKLKRRLTMPIFEFAEEIQQFGGVEKVTTGKYAETLDSRYFFKDNGSHVLAVAHLDTAMYIREVAYIHYADHPTIVSPMLDDRLGAYIILDLLPKLGVKTDILLTTGEERCASTAAHFRSDKKYNWGFSFDRHGLDTVLYGYGQYTANERWQTALKAADLTLGVGTYSDISDLESLNCKMANIGTAYYGEHSKMCHALLDQVVDQVGKFVEFYKAFSDTRFIHQRGSGSYSKWSCDYNYGRQDWKNYGRKWDKSCVYCGTVLFPEEEACGMCSNCQDYYSTIGNEGPASAKADAETVEYMEGTDGYWYDSNGNKICELCGARLTAHEDEQGLCDDCAEEERRVAKKDTEKDEGGAIYDDV